MGFIFDNFTQCVNMNVSQTDMNQLQVMLANSGHYQFETPSNDEQTLNSTDTEKWELARAQELQACKSNSTWGNLQDLPKGKKFVNLGFIYNVKRSGEDVPPRFKARLVYKNHPFVNSSSWDQVFAPVVDKATLRIFFTISGRERLYLRQADVVTAYLNANMYEEVYIKLPKICEDNSNQV